MTNGYKDGNNKFHPISNKKGVTRKKRLSESEHPTVSNGILINKQMHNESIRLKKDDHQNPKGLKLMDNSELKCVVQGSPCATEAFLHVFRTTHVSPELQKDAKKMLVDRHLNTIERYYVDKKGSLANREHAIDEVKKLTGEDPRMFGKTDGDILKAIRMIRKEHKTRESRYARDVDPRFAEIKNKKSFIEPLVQNILTKDDDGRDIIMARNYALDFSSPYLYFGITESGNVKLGEVTQFAFKGQPEEVRNFLGQPRLDSGNDTLKISIDGSTFSATIGQNNLSDLLARNKAKGNVK